MDARKRKTSNSGLTQRFQVPSFCAEKEKTQKTGERINPFTSLKIMSIILKYYSQAKMQSILFDMAANVTVLRLQKLFTTACLKF